MLAVQSAQTPLGFDAADVIAFLAIIVTIGLALLSTIATLVFYELRRLNSRIESVSDDAENAVRDLRRDLGSDLSQMWYAIRSPGRTWVEGPPTATKEGNPA